LPTSFFRPYSFSVVSRVLFHQFFPFLQRPSIFIVLRTDGARQNFFPSSHLSPSPPLPEVRTHADLPQWRPFPISHFPYFLNGFAGAFSKFAGCVSPNILGSVLLAWDSQVLFLLRFNLPTPSSCLNFFVWSFESAAWKPLQSSGIFLFLSGTPNPSQIEEVIVFPLIFRLFFEGLLYIFSLLFLLCSARIPGPSHPQISTPSSLFVEKDFPLSPF